MKKDSSMKKTRSKTKPVDDLRKRAEKKSHDSPDSIEKMSPVDVRKLVHELRVHQIELEMQNDELRRSQIETADERRKYTDLYDFAPVGYFTFDGKGNITEANVTGASLLGYEKRFLAGKPFHRFIMGTHLSIFQSHLLKVIELRNKQSCKLKLARKDGSFFDAMIETISVTDGDGKFDHYRSSVTDITEITKAGDALQESEERYRHIVEDSTEFIGRAKADGTITFVNEALCRYFLMPSDDLLGKNIIDFIPYEDREAVLSFLSSFTSKNRSANIEQRVLMPNGDIRWHFWSARAIYDRHDRFIEFQGAGHDITTRKQAEEELKERAAQLEEANRELEGFSYSISHDLRSPLRAIDGYARMILRKHGDKFDEDARSKFNVIRSSIQMMGHLIDDLLAFSHLGRKHISVSKIDMAHLVRDVWIELQAENKGRKIELTLNGLLPGYGDMALIKQVYVNLLANAVKFTKHRDVAHIETGSYTEGNENVYYIRDNGIGFDMAYYDKLFGVFQRLHGTDDSEGTGVGLAIVQRIIHKHGGRVWAEAKPDQGARFYFTLSGKE
jgi:PAS domain S-box-containing protein